MRNPRDRVKPLWSKQPERVISHQESCFVCEIFEKFHFFFLFFFSTLKIGALSFER